MEADIPLTASSRIVATRDQVSCDLEGEAAVLKLSTAMYYGLDSVGAAIWNAIQSPTDLAAVHGLLIREYEVDAETAEADLLAFIQEMMREGLVEFSD